MTSYRLRLEYCCPIWNPVNPHYIKDVKLVEDVQRRGTKLVWSMENIHYEERLKKLGVMHLDRRRARSDLLEAFKVISGQYDITLDT